MASMKQFVSLAESIFSVPKARSVFDTMTCDAAKAVPDDARSARSPGDARRFMQLRAGLSLDSMQPMALTRPELCGGETTTVYYCKLYIMLISQRCFLGREALHFVCFSPVGQRGPASTAAGWLLL